MIGAGLISPKATGDGVGAGKDKKSVRDSVASLKAVAVVEEDEEALRLRLEALGVHVGANLAERLCKDRPRFTDTLDAIKFVCKDIWTTVWDKQVDNLRTNHRGVYVLSDNTFKPLLRLSSPLGPQDTLRRARTYASLPAGIIKGALGRLDLHATSVVPEISVLPACTFQIKLPKGA